MPRRNRRPLSGTRRRARDYEPAPSEKTYEQMARDLVKRGLASQLILHGPYTPPQGWPGSRTGVRRGTAGEVPKESVRFKGA